MRRITSALVGALAVGLLVMTAVVRAQHVDPFITEHRLTSLETSIVQMAADIAEMKRQKWNEQLLEWFKTTCIALLTGAEARRVYIGRRKEQE